MAAAVAAAAAGRADGAPSPQARAFPLTQVRLKPGLFLTSAEINRRYMMSLDADRLLHMFRVTANLPSKAEPLGGWEQPANELRGHFTGHYLSACALIGSTMGDEEIRRRGAALVSELAKCQKAIGNGYLSAFPEELFDRLRNGVRVWAPFYTIHKIMQGLLDMHTLAGNEQALDVAKGMARWTQSWAQPLGDAHMARVLEVEYGGMNDFFYNLHAATGDGQHLALAHRFDHERIFAPLAEGRDELKGLHVNTQIPKIIGAARRYELAGERRYHDIAHYFWHEVTGKRSFCTGGTSSDEGWPTDAGKLSKELGGYTQECCCTYNMLKLTRHLFQWSPQAHYADYYERALYNGILGTQHPEDGMTLYYVPLESGYWKLFGLPLHAFWCCTGTGVESFGKLTDSIYFHDDSGIWVNLFIPSEVTWQAKGVTLVQETAFPEEEATRLTVRTKSPAKMSLRLRVPYWTAPGGTVSVNGRPLESFASPGSYVVLDRTWQDGDKVELRLPMRLHVHPMPDDESLQAFLYGPLVLVGDLGAEGLTKETLRAEPTPIREIPRYKLKPVPAPELRAKGKIDEWVKPVAGRRLHFQTVGQARDLTLLPFYQLLDRRYGVYWKVSG